MSGISEDYTNKVLQMHMHALTMACQHTKKVINLRLLGNISKINNTYFQKNCNCVMLRVIEKLNDEKNI